MPLAAALTATLVNVPRVAEAVGENGSVELGSRRGAETQRKEGAASGDAIESAQHSGASRTDAHVRRAPPLPPPAVTDVGVRPAGQETSVLESAGSQGPVAIRELDPAVAGSTGESTTADSLWADAEISSKSPALESASVPQSVQVWLSTLYVAGVSLMLLRLALGLRGGTRLKRLASPVNEPELLASLARQIEQVGLRAWPALAWCGRVAVPTVVGVLRPMILLPVGFATGLTARQLEALLAHELIHIRRWDPVVNLLQRLVEAAFFFHPAVWFVSKQIRHERENCTDDAVVGLGFPSVEYAKTLLRAAELAVFGRTPASDLVAVRAGENSSQLTRRVRRLLNSREHEVVALSRPGFLALLLAIAGSAAIAGSTGLSGDDAQVDPATQEETKPGAKAEETAGKDEEKAEAGGAADPAPQVDGAEVVIKGEIRDGILRRSFELTRSKEKARPHIRVGFPGGVEFTLLGITKYPYKAGDDWWLPTGEALPGRPVHFVAPAFEGNLDRERRAVLVRVDGMPPWITAQRTWRDDRERGAKSSPERGLFLVSKVFPQVVEVGENQRYARVLLKIAEAELEQAEAANRKLAGTVPKAEIQRLQRAVRRAKLADKRAQAERENKSDTAEFTLRFPGGPWETEALFRRVRNEKNGFGDENAKTPAPAPEFEQVVVALGLRGDISIEPPRNPNSPAWAIGPTCRVRVTFPDRNGHGNPVGTRAVAVDSAGHRIYPTGHTNAGKPGKGVSRTDFFFPLEPLDIQELWIESAEFVNSVRFSGLATKAAQKAKPRVEITAPVVPEVGEFAYSLSKKIESQVVFSDPMDGIRAQREFMELLSRYGPAKPDAEFQSALREALDGYLNRIWPNTKGMRDSYAWDDIHLHQQQRVRSLQWAVFQFLDAYRLSQQDQLLLGLQREAIENRIRKAATGDHRGSLEKWLAEFDRLLHAPFFPCFKKPLSKEQFAEFEESLDDVSEPFSIGRLVDAWAEIQFPTSQSGSDKPAFVLSNFREPVWRFAWNEKTSHLTAQFFSAAQQSGVEVALERIDRNGAFIELQSGLAGAASGGAELVRTFSKGGERATGDWFGNRESGAFYLDAKTSRLVGVRGTKFLWLNTRFWREADWIPTSRIARAIEKSGSTEWRFWNPEQPKNGRPVSDVNTMAAAQTADGRVYILRLARQNSDAALRVRPHDTPTPESGQVPEADARLIVQGEISDVDSEIGRRFVRVISDRQYDAKLEALVEEFVDQLRSGDGAAAEFMTPGVSPRTIRSWEWWGDVGSAEIQDEWKRLRKEVADGRFRIGEGGFRRLRFWQDFGFNVVRSDKRGYFRLIGVDAAGQQWLRVFLLERIGSRALEGSSGWMITGYTQGRMRSEDFLYDSPAHSPDWKEMQKFQATSIQVESGDRYLDLDTGRLLTQPRAKATSDWIRARGVDLRFGSKATQPMSLGIDLFGTNLLRPGDDFSRLSPGGALQLLGRQSAGNAPATGVALVRTRSGGVFVLQTRSRKTGGMDLRVRELSRDKLASKVTIEGLSNPGPNADLPTGTDWQEGRYGIEYRIRQEKKTWRIGEHPLVFVDLRSTGQTERLAVSKSQFQHYIDYAGGRYSRSVGGTFHAIPTEGHLSLAFVLSPLWQRVPHKDPMRLEPGRHNLKIYVRLGTLPLYDDDGNIVRPPGEQFRPEPVGTVPVAIVISKDDVRGKPGILAANIRRELIGLTEFHTSMKLPHTLQNMIAQNLPGSADLLLTLCESDDADFAQRAATVLVRFLDDLSDEQATRYLASGFAHFAEKRNRYPRGIDALIGLGFRFNFGHEGLPKDRKYKFQTTTRHFLDGEEFGERYSYEGPGAGSGHVKLKDLELGNHSIRMTTEWGFTRGERTLKGTFDSGDLTFEIAPTDTPNRLIAESDPELAKIVQEAMQFRESETSFQRRSRFRPQRDRTRAWRPNTYTEGAALHTPVWRMNRPLPVDLAFRLKIKVEGTDLGFPCYDVVVLAGERTYSRYIHTSGRLTDVVKKLREHADENDFVKVRLVLTPSREVALQNPKIKKYFPGSITSEVLRLRASTTSAVPPSLPLPDPKHQSEDDNG